MSLPGDIANAMRFLGERFPEMEITYGHPMSGPQPGELTVGVGVACCVVDRHGKVRDAPAAPVLVSTDTAGDLSWRPKVMVSLSCGDPAPLEWLVISLALVEAEAADACERVAALVPQAWMSAMNQAQAQ